MVGKARKDVRIRDVYPKYARNFLWEEERRPSFRKSADLSDTATPVPSPPDRSSFCQEFLDTLDSHLHLFRIVTPIDVDRLQFLLHKHPNCPFVDSVICMLREGARPWASAPPADFLLINDMSQDNVYIQC